MTDETPPDRTWQFTIYGGLYPLSAVRDALVSAFGPDNRYTDGPPKDETALFAFTLDAQGCLMKNSTTLSACSWAISRLQSPGPSERSWLDGFETEQREFSLGLNTLVPPKTRNTPLKGTLSKATTVVREQAKSAAIDAVAAGAKATGVAVTAATATAVSSVAGPIVGGIAGTVAGRFAETLLTPKANGDSQNEPRGDTPGTGDRPTTTGARPKTFRPQMTAKALHDFVADLATELGVATALKAAGIRVKCTKVRVRDPEKDPEKDTDEAAEQNFLNSFIANDLSQVERAIRAADIGAGLASYLTDSRDIPLDQRVDVRRDAGKAAVLTGVAPHRIPGGRWPTDTSKPLVLSQQFAVNQIRGDLAGAAGIFAVNGPPGTGKTTMLRDVLAAVVVDRARQLAELHNPEAAFTDKLGGVAVTETYTATVRGLLPEVTGFEVVVATASNGAAENITAEIPGVKAVGERNAEALAVDYFTGLASHVLRDKAWGLIAAKLGKQGIRRDFAKRFWWGDDSPERRDESSQPGMKEILQRAWKQPETVEGWDTAVARFKDAAADVQRLTAERQRVADAITELPQCHARVSDTEKEVRDAEHRCQQLREEGKQNDELLAQAATEYRAIDDEYQDHAQHQPGFWVSVSTFFRAGLRWNNRHEELERQRAACKRELGNITQRVSRHKRALTEAVTTRQRHEYARNDAEHDLATARRCIDAARERWPATVPFFPDSVCDEERQMCAPWADQDLTAARNQLFLEALRLHKTFILRAGPALRHNLAAIMAIISDNRPGNPDVRLAAWQSLFLVVPVMSTTFASLPRLFAELGREELGWLFIDEAGQATPQQAVGGIWRARRTVIVGDPRQLEPIVTLPPSAQHALLRHCDVDEQWTPQITSAQRVADRLARFGTRLADQDGESMVWVGAPLRVHRRCDRPMFDISNTIAYGGSLMVYGTRHEGDFPGENCWIDVRSGQSARNWVPAEGVELARLLHTLTTEHDVEPRDIRVISPFRDVVNGAKKIGRQHVGSLAETNVGTVHTVQGKEADVVVVVLGSAPKNNGARAWAAESPNLLNVAVSRARRRLYVIGNRQNWQDHRYFDVLAAALPNAAAAPEASTVIDQPALR
ncbi:MAG: DEAD/DEAH box helicase [Pseudonocardiaceae bacterium]